MRIDGPNLYLRYLNQDDIDGLQGAIQGFWKDGRTVSIRETYRFKYGVEQAKEGMFSNRQLEDDDVNECCFAVCLQDNTVIGYNITLFEGKRMESTMTAFLPEYRSNGHYREVIYLRHRLGFDALGAERSLMKIPIEGSSAMQAVLDALYSDSVYEFQFQNDVWRLGELTEPHYRAYLEANPEVANTTWSFSWS